MKINLFILAICLATFSCDDPSDNTNLDDSLIGFWSVETVYLNGVNSLEYVDFLNGGNFLEIKEDNTFQRAYEFGTWSRSNLTLTLDRDENTGRGDWAYRILKQTKMSLVLETKLKEGEYCCGFPQFDDDEIITIREVYKKVN
jgi:hypothetical protein